MPKPVILKHDITINWEKALNFIPKQGEIIIYDDKNPSFKIGDGIHNVNDLPFVNDLTWNDFPSAEKGEK